MPAAQSEASEAWLTDSVCFGLLLGIEISVCFALLLGIEISVCFGLLLGIEISVCFGLLVGIEISVRSSLCCVGSVPDSRRASKALLVVFVSFD